MRNKVWLRKKATREYFSASGQWILNRAGAFDFVDVQRAFTYAHSSSIPGLEVVLKNDTRELTLQVISSSYAR